MVKGILLYNERNGHMEDPTVHKSDRNEPNERTGTKKDQTKTQKRTKKNRTSTVTKDRSETKIDLTRTTK